MNRRSFIGIVTGGLLAVGLDAEAERVWRIAYLTFATRPAPDTTPPWDAFIEQLRQLGYVEGRNLSIEWRSADGHADRLLALASELVQLKPDLIVVPNTQTTMAVKRATTTIPIVITAATDPVELGLVNNLARPGGNVTGFVVTGGELTRKRLELLLQVVPSASRIAALAAPTNKSHVLYWVQTQTAADALAVRLQRFE